MKRFLLVLVLLLSVCWRNSAWSQAPLSASKTAAKTNYTISAKKYADGLRHTIRALDKWQNGPLPTLPVLRGVFPSGDERLVKRADGQTQTARGDSWERVLDEMESSRNAKTLVRRGEIRALRAQIAQRLTALQSWMKARKLPTANAQSIISKLAGEGEIRTGPTALQQWWQSVKDAIGNFFRRLFSRSVSRATPSQTPSINSKWAEWLFVSCVLCLLGAIGWYVWRTLGGRWVRNAKREVRFVGEDAELLQLAPDELLSRADRLAQKGDFAGALRHRFIGLLVTLDERGVWRYDTRRTNWEHIAALKKAARWQALALPLSDLTRRFDRVRYGNAPCQQNDWTRFAQDAESLENQLSQAIAGAPAAPSSTRSGAAT
jgi:hypothetical protein